VQPQRSISANDYCDFTPHLISPETTSHNGIWIYNASRSHIICTRLIGYPSTRISIPAVPALSDDTMPTELLINDPKCELITLVPDGYKPKHARTAQPERNISGTDGVKSYPWDCGAPRELSESEKLVPKSYRPGDRDSVQGVESFDGTRWSKSSMASQGNFGSIGPVMQMFKRCFDSPNSGPAVALQGEER
jgi:hypothetical protein